MDICWRCKRDDPPCGISSDPKVIWIACDSCDNWFHCCCMKMSGQAPAGFICSSCSSKILLLCFHVFFHTVHVYSSDIPWCTLLLLVIFNLYVCQVLLKCDQFVFVPSFIQSVYTLQIFLGSPCSLL